MEVTSPYIYTTSNNLPSLLNACAALCLDCAGHQKIAGEQVDGELAATGPALRTARVTEGGGLL